MNSTLLFVLTLFYALLAILEAKPIIASPPSDPTAPKSSPVNDHWKEHHSAHGGDETKDSASDKRRTEEEHVKASNDDDLSAPCNPPPWRRNRFLQPPSPYLPRCPPN